MKVIVYYRQPHDPAIAERELAIQRASVAEWMAAMNATVVAEFTEQETATNSRPAFGKARQEAKRVEATLLVATTKALGTNGEFKPSDIYGGISIRCLADPAERARELWERSERLVVYYRVVADDEDASRLSLEKQRDGVAMIAYPDIYKIVAELTETEMSGLRDGQDAIVKADAPDANAPATDRPQLLAALDLCRREQARLVIGTTDAIGAAPEFVPDTDEVPTEIAWRAADAWNAVLPAPTDATVPFVSLHLGRRFVRNRRPLYLANRTGTDLFDVTVQRSGWTSDYGDLTVLNPFDVALDHVADRMSCLAGDYDVFVHCDFIITWTIQARSAGGLTFRGTVTLDKGAPAGRLLVARDWQRVGHEETEAD